MKRKFTKSQLNQNNIRICSYNILAPSVSENNNLHKISCKGDCIKWSYRFELIKKEINEINPDIICFQEAQTDKAHTDIIKYFKSQNYYGFYIPQYHTRKGAIKTEDDNFGIIILYSLKKFICTEISSINYPQLLEKYIKDLSLNLQGRARGKRYCGLCLGLLDRKSNKKFYICSVHLEAFKNFEDVKNLQAYITMKFLSKLSEGNKIPVILCGDFNSIPSSSVYHGITKGISLNQFEIKDNPETIKTPNIFTENAYKSTFYEIYKKEPEFTNYTLKFKNTLDYIFVNSHFKIIDALNEIKEKLGLSIPSKKYPSDHILICADLLLK